jgi:hypothetical protein
LYIQRPDNHQAKAQDLLSFMGVFFLPAKSGDSMDRFIIAARALVLAACRTDLIDDDMASHV